MIPSALAVPSRRALLGLAVLTYATQAQAAAAGRRGDFIGDRPFPFNPKSPVKGPQGPRIVSGETYRNMRARNFGNGMVRIAGEVDRLTMEDIQATNFYRLIECAQGASLSNFVVRRVRAKGFERSVARLRGQSRNGLFEDIWADSEAQMGDPFAVGFALEEGCHDITYRRCTVLRCQTPLVDKVYRQGDGFSDEEQCHNISYIDTLAQQCTDGGYDLKSKNLTMVRARAVGNKRNFRFWANNRLSHIISESPEWSHVSVHGGEGARTVRIDRLEVRADKPSPIFQLDAKGGTTLSIGSYDIRTPPGTPVLTGDSGPAHIDWGSQGPPRGLEMKPEGRAPLR